MRHGFQRQKRAGDQGPPSWDTAGPDPLEGTASQGQAGILHQQPLDGNAKSKQTLGPCGGIQATLASILGAMANCRGIRGLGRRLSQQLTSVTPKPLSCSICLHSAYLPAVYRMHILPIHGPHAPGTPAPTHKARACVHCAHWDSPRAQYSTWSRAGAPRIPAGWKNEWLHVGGLVSHPRWGLGHNSKS